MNLYHYNKQAFPILKTLEKQGTTLEVEGTPNYGKHISFFLEPIPYEFLGTIFGKDHHIWFPGNVVQEHTVVVKDIGGFTYSLVESPEKTVLFYDENISESLYIKKLTETIKENNYEGNDPKVLEKLQIKLKGTTREFYAKLPGRPNFEKIKNKYAPTVPHLMIYPESGIAPVRLHKQIKIGNKPIPKLNFESIVGYSSWK